MNIYPFKCINLVIFTFYSITLMLLHGPCSSLPSLPGAWLEHIMVTQQPSPSTGCSTHNGSPEVVPIGWNGARHRSSQETCPFELHLQDSSQSILKGPTAYEEPLYTHPSTRKEIWFHIVNHGRLHKIIKRSNGSKNSKGSLLSVLNSITLDVFPKLRNE